MPVRSPGRSRPAARGTDRPRRTRRALLWGLLGLALAVLGTGGWLYHQLNGKLSSVDIDAELAEQGAERPEDRPEGGRAILVLGTDSASDLDGPGQRPGAAPPASGEALPTSGAAVVVRLPDGGGAPTAVGIPATHPVPAPTCATEAPPGAGVPAAGNTDDADEGRPDTPTADVAFHTVRAAGGPGCVVRVVEGLSGMRMDHYIEVDVAGLGELVDALGGISVELTEPVRDDRSGVTLAAGPQRLDGSAAMAAARAAGPEEQQRLLVALLAEIRDQDVLGSPTTLYRVAEAAAATLTTDAGLGSVPDLVAFARDLSTSGTDGVEVLALPVDAPGAEPVWESLRGEG
ncbi:LCP family protein [Streptomyces spiramenti]|uniref:LytR family transcriptional regulator n=1 Tax=Streptomyces spiramenti TaxID=2720606 RepID=A0ABX1AMM9_9ACTN|nr:LCP family protein [Streptomyces spiramenti]NJP66906.1 LytR family transcriptional regulator [Streptomyces spiramenti]